MPHTAPETAVRLACRRLERAGGVAELGTDLGRYLTGSPGTRAEAIRVGYLRADLRLTLAGLALLSIERVDRAARAAVAGQEEVARQRLQEQEIAARAERAAREMEVLRVLDALAGLRGELAAARDALDGLDACRDLKPENCHLAAARAPGGSCAGPGPRRLPHCWARWDARCRQPRHEPILRYLPGGGGSAPKPSPAAVKARREYEQARALGKLALAARRFRLAWGLLRGTPLMAGWDLAPFISNTRKGRRHARPLFSLGLLEQDVMVSERSPARLTAAGVAWLREQAEQHAPAGPAAPAVALAA